MKTNLKNTADRKLNRLGLALAGLTLAFGSQFAGAQQLSGPGPMQNVAQLAASGTVEVQQDMLTMTLSATRDGTDANTVQSQLKTALDAALTEAKKTASPGQLDVRTGNFNIYPRYDKNSKINGWVGSTELVLEGRDIPRITAAAGKISTMTMSNVSFGLSRESRLKVEGDAQAQAIDRFKAKAAEISRSFGFSSFTLREVSVSASDQGSIPRPRMMAMESKMASDSAPVPVEAGKTTVMVNVSGSVQMK